MKKELNNNYNDRFIVRYTNSVNDLCGVYDQITGTWIALDRSNTEAVKIALSYNNVCNIVTLGKRKHLTLYQGGAK